MREESAKGTTVDAIYEEPVSSENIVDATHPLEDVVHAFTFKNTHTLYVVDASDRYRGVITENTLLEWLRHNLGGPHALDHASPNELGHRFEDATAEEAVHPRSGELPVEPHEPVLHALRSMLSSSLLVAPVVAADGSLEGELRFTRVVQHALDQG